MRDRHPYTVRFGLGMLMSFYLDGEFRPEYLDLAAGVRREEYYVRMMVAWYFATALAKQYDAALPYLEERRLDRWTHNKTIQKAVESYRITPEQKDVAPEPPVESVSACSAGGGRALFPPSEKNLKKQKISVDISILPCYTNHCSERETRTVRTAWGYSSAGRAHDWQSRGQRFDPAYLHQKETC